MKQVKPIEKVYTAPNDVVYITENGLYVRDVIIDASLSEPVYIGHISDLHYNYCNDADFSEGNPVILSTYENRLWLKNGASVPIVRRCIEFLDDVDQLVINGDTLDYLSNGAMELMQTEIWDKYPDVIATLGGHEFTRVMQGKVMDNTTYESRVEILKKFWKHDIYYVSKLIKNKVLIVGLLNNMWRYNSYQAEKLKNDIELARKNGYVILIFQHEPMWTLNPKYLSVNVDDLITKGDISGFPIDLCSMPNNPDEATLSVHNLIFNNADVIKGVFAGHQHDDMYLELLAKTFDGEEALIPQFVNTVTAHQEGHLMRITVK